MVSLGNWWASSAAQSQNVLRNPCCVISDRCIFFIRARNALLLKPVLCFQPEKTCSFGFWFEVILLSISTALCDRGKRCSVPTFIRYEGIVQTAFSRSISDHLVPMISLVRAAVSIKNFNPRAEYPDRVLSSLTKLSISLYGRVGKWRTRFTFAGFERI